MSKADFFGILVLCCEEAKNASGDFLRRTSQKIDAILRREIRIARTLYNPYRTLYLNKCYGESKTPLGAWLPFDPEDEV